MLFLNVAAKAEIFTADINEKPVPATFLLRTDANGVLSLEEVSSYGDFCEWSAYFFLRKSAFYNNAWFAMHAFFVQSLIVRDECHTAICGQ